MKYYINFISPWNDNPQLDEKLKCSAEIILRQFLLEKADKIRLTRYIWGIIFKHGQDSDPKFIMVKNNLNTDLLRVEKNNTKFNDIEQGNQVFEHYFYQFSDNIKNLLNKETLFFDQIPNSSKSFYGFQDPTFYINNKMLSCVISHEQEIIFDLSEKEISLLKSKSVPIEAY
jgi:hypothetical protein